MATRAPFAALEGDALTLLNVFLAFQHHTERGATTAPEWCRRNRLSIAALRQAARVRSALGRQLRRFGIETDGASGANPDSVRRALVRGFFSTAARRTEYDASGGATYSLVRGGSARCRLLAQSVLWRYPPEWLLVHVTSGDASTGGDGGVVCASSVEAAWLAELAPHFFEVSSGRAAAASSEKRLRWL